MKKNILVKLSFFKAALLCSVAATPAYAVDVTDWAGLSAIGDAAAAFINDIEATGTPKVVNFASAVDQVIDGGGYNVVGADGYSMTDNKTANLTLQNWGSAGAGTADNNTFSYTDMDGNTVYTKINASAHDFPKYFMTVYTDDAILNVNNSVFTNNGGRLLISSKGTQIINVKNSVFYNNSSDQNTAMIAGGASTLNIENSIFYNNANIKSNGGVADGFSNTTIKNSYFINNSAVFGGVINQISGTMTIDGSRFEGNTSSKDGGAICLDTNINVGYIKDSVFVNNHNGGSYYDGGAISTTGGYIETMENVVFDGNRAVSGGGGVWGAMASKHNTKNPVLFKNVVFKNNEAGTGAGYYSEGSNRQHYTYITDSEFTNNIAKASGHYLSFGSPYGGGVISTGKVPMVINNTTFSGNKALNDGNSGYSAGGGMYFGGSKKALYPLKVIDSTFTNNEAFEGGALFVDNADAAIIAETKDVEFSGNSAGANTDTYNGGDDIYFQANSYGTLSLNAADGKKVVFNGSIASWTGKDAGAVMNINNSGVTYNTYDGTTETENTAGTAGEIQFNNKVGDEEGNIFDINLYGGKLSIGQNSTINSGVTNPDGFINNNNFYVKGASTLNTVNGIIGEFAPKTFQIDSTMTYEFDIDLANKKADMLKGAVNNANVELSVLNIISDSDESNLKVVYSDKNVNGSLKDGYTITTSSATYDILAENHDSGSYLMFAKDPSAMTGLPGAIVNGSDAYSNTSGDDEVIEKWSENDLINDLVVNGNSHGFTTENALDGINVDSDRTLTMNNVSDMSGFNYDILNAGTVDLNNTTLSDEVINNGTLNVNNGSSLQDISGSGTTNINTDYELQGTVSGNTVNVNGATLSGVDKLASDTTLNAVGGTVDLKNKQATVKEANFDATSSLLVTVNSLSDHGSLTADTITVAEGAKLKATLAQGIVGNNESATVQLLSANNTDFNNFSDSFDNNIYHFEKADANGAYTITRSSSAEDVVSEAGGSHWVANAAKAYVDGGAFKDNTVAKKVADQLAGLVQNDAEGFIKEMKALAPTETPMVQGQVVSNVSRLFKTVDAYLHGSREFIGMSAGDTWSDVSIWATPYAGKSKIDRRGNISGQKTSSLGIIAGIEKKLQPDLKVGGGLHYDEADIRLDRRDIDAKTILAFIYGEYRKNKLFVNGIASQALSKYDERKVALGNKYKANWNVNTSSVAIAAGYELKYVTPEVGMHYYHINREGYTDSAAQHVRESDTDYLRATMGLRYATEYQNFHPYVYAGVNYDVISPDNNTIVNLANGTSYTVEGKKLPRLEYAFNVGVTKEVLEDLTLGISYMGAYRKNYQEHTGFVKARYDF